MNQTAATSTPTISESSTAVTPPSILNRLRSLIPPARKDISFDEALNLAERQATLLGQLLAADSSDEGILEAQLAELPRIRITREALASVGSSHWNGQEWIICLNREDPLTRQRFTLLHEFKHIIDHGAATRLYRGDRRRQAGELFEGRHEAIVSRPLFERVQDVLEVRSNPAVHDHTLTHYLKGMLYCDRCEQAGQHARLIYTEVTNGKGGRYGYYKCRNKSLGSCDLPHLPVALVEQKLCDSYTHVRLSPDYLAEFTEAIETALHDQQAGERELARQLAQEQSRLDEQENRLLDLVQEGTLPKHKLQERLNDIARKRGSLTTRLTAVKADLDTGAELLRLSLELAKDPHALYLAATDDARGQINKAFFTALYLDDHGDVATSTWTKSFTTLRTIHSTWLELPANSHESRSEEKTDDRPSRLERALRLAKSDKSSKPTPVYLGVGLNSSIMVGRAGLEPATNRLCILPQLSLPLSRL